MSISVAIQHGGDTDTFRRSCVLGIRKAIGNSAEQVHVVKDPERKGSLASFINCMRTHKDADWHLIIQDDVEFLLHNPIHELDRLTEVVTPGIVTLFAPRKEVTNMPYGYLSKVYGTWGQANLFHKSIIPDFLDWVVPRKYLVKCRIGDDRVMSAYAYENNIDVYTPNPSLVEHVGHNRSMFGHAMGLKARTTRTTIDSAPGEWKLSLNHLGIGKVPMSEIDKAVEKRQRRLF